MIGDHSIFEKEESIIAQAQALLRQKPASISPDSYAALLDQYAKLYRQSKRLINMGDRMQGQLNRLYDQLTKSEEKYRSIFERSIQGIFRADASGRFLDVNPAMAKMFEYESPEEMVGCIEDIVTEICFSREQASEFIELLRRNRIVRDFPMWLRRRRGRAIWVEVCVQGVFDDMDDLIELEGLVIDVTEKRQMLDELKKMARVDELTGIWNRRYFLELGEREVARAKRGQTALTLLYFDLDRFKDINDTYGHQVGDRVLKEMATLGLDALREIDIFGRMGGDEFAILLPETTMDGAMHVAEKVRMSFNEHAIILPQTKIHFSASFGVAQFGLDTSCLSSLIKSADQCLYAAKTKGRNAVAFPEMTHAGP